MWSFMLSTGPAKENRTLAYPPIYLPETPLSQLQLCLPVMLLLPKQWIVEPYMPSRIFLAPVCHFCTFIFDF